MKRQNCVQVKNVNKLSIPYLTRFFGSVGPIVKVQKDEITKFVTIVDVSILKRVFRFEGRILDKSPIKIKKQKQHIPFGIPSGLQSLSLNEQKSKSKEEIISSDGSQEEMWLLIHNEIKPHHFEESEHLLMAMFVWGLIDEISNDAKHLMKYRMNIRSNYLKIELERQIIERIIRKNKNSVAISDSLTSVVLEWKDREALAWFTVPYPNIQEEQSKIEAASLLTKCIGTIRNSLSLRISEVIVALNAASLCFNLQETGIEELITFKSQVSSSEEDNFMGIVQNIGAKDIFFQFLSYQQCNSCIFLKENKILGVFQCSLRLKASNTLQLRDEKWCQLYQGQLCKREVLGSQKCYYVRNKKKVQSIKLGEQTLIFQNAIFSYQGLERQLMIFKQIQSEIGVQVIYISNQEVPEKIHHLKKEFSDGVLQIYNQVEENKIVEPKRQLSSQVLDEFITFINVIQIKSENMVDLNSFKLSHYLLNYIQQSVIAKGLIIASKDMATKLASNIISREQENRLFEFAHKRYEKYIGEQLWRLYNSRGERKIKSLLTKYTGHRQ